MFNNCLEALINKTTNSLNFKNIYVIYEGMDANSIEITLSMANNNYLQSKLLVISYSNDFIYDTISNFKIDIPLLCLTFSNKFITIGPIIDDILFSIDNFPFRTCIPFKTFEITYDKNLLYDILCNLSLLLLKSSTNKNNIFLINIQRSETITIKKYPVINHLPPPMINV